MALSLSPVALIVTLGYSLTKRFTWTTHFVLGLALSIAPIGAWVAVKATLDAPVLVLGLAVLLWTAGFDLLYSCQDVDFDRAHGLRSLPSRFGVPSALVTARALHGGSFAALVAFGLVLGLGAPYAAGTAAAGAVMAWSHSLVSSRDLSPVGVAFFQANVTVSVLVLFGTAVDVLA